MLDPRRLAWCGGLLTLVGLLGLASEGAAQSCTPIGQNVFVRSAMTDLYYWYEHLPALDPAAFDSPEGYLDAVRYRPLDTSFSYISGRAADDAFYSDSQFIGFGLSYKIEGTEMRVTQVYPESPAAEAGLARGLKVTAVGGRAVEELVVTGELAAAFGPSQLGVEVTIAFLNADGVDVQATMVKRLVTIPTVSHALVLDVDGAKVGYLHFRNFVQPSFTALDDAFRVLKEQGARELVLDLRYNGGGLVSVAQHLASLVGGPLTTGQVFAEFFHNAKNRFRNQSLRFEGKDNALGLDRLVVITTRASASASELVINALRPFIPVVVIGDRTYGKPVGQYSVPFCDKVLHPVAFSLRNANGEGDFFDGLPATCAAADDLAHEFGDPAESSLAEALAYLRTGACSPVPEPAEPTRWRLRRDRALDAISAWQLLLGAY